MSSTILNTDALRRLAGMARGSPAAAPAARPAGAGPATPYLFDLDAFLSDHPEIEVDRREPWDGGERVILARCLFDPTHVGTCATLGRTKTGALYYKCQHDSCAGRRWKDVRTLFGIPARPPKAPRSGNPNGATVAELAEQIIADLYSSHPDGPTMRYWEGQWYSWTGKAYSAVHSEIIEDKIHLWLSEKGVDAKIRLVKEVAAALRARIRIPSEAHPPAWIGGDHPGDPEHLLVMKNGVLDVHRAARGKLELAEFTPDLFTMSAVPYEFDPAAECPAWCKFILDVMSGDMERVNLLAQWFGYCLTSSTRLHAIMMFVGPPRSGKGTLIRILQHLVGVENVTSPQLTDLGSEFGAWNMIGKKLAVFPDASMPSGGAALRILERLKSISGEDRIQINRKNLQAVETQLGVRCLIAANEIPKFADQAQALKTRMLIVPFEQSYAGVEDRQLDRKLFAELPGIFNWSICGLAKLLDAKGFIETAKGTAMLEVFAETSSPCAEFVAEVFDVDMTNEDYRVNRNKAWELWQDWCKKNGHAAGSRSRLGVFLRAVLPRLRDIRTRDSDSRDRCYVGIRIKPEVLYNAQ